MNGSSKRSPEWGARISAADMDKLEEEKRQMSVIIWLLLKKQGGRAVITKEELVSVRPENTIEITRDRTDESLVITAREM